jgi:glycosyltransferase involved in cell wall biosynthesis
MPRVSVIVPAYNAAQYLPASLDSVIAQTYRDWEVIVVDDGSSDNTQTVLASYRARLNDKIRCIHQANRGPSAARNAGIRTARGEVIAMLDADDIWLPSRLERSVQELDRDANVGLVHARVARINQQGFVIDEPFANRKYLAGRISHYIYTRRAHIMCPTVTFRKCSVDTNGAFDETLHAAEDRDLWFRIARKFKVAYIDEILAQYRLSPASLSKDNSRMVTSDLTFVEKYYRAGCCSRLQRRRALGTIYRESGDLLFKKVGLKGSLRSYLKSVLYDPFSLLNVYMLARAVADPLIPKALTADGKRHGKVVRVKMQ